MRILYDTPSAPSGHPPQRGRQGPRRCVRVIMMYYDHKNVVHARNLRKEMTPWERKLWYCFLKNLPIRFQRQKVIGSYIADFYCAKANLIIELDGGGHYNQESEQKDRIRTEKLEENGLKVIRFCNKDVDKNFYGVCTAIEEEIKCRTLPQSR